MNYLAAHVAMHRTASVRSGECILVQGAAGGVGSALLELGKLAGLEMYGTASSYNHELVSALGATPIDYHTEDVVERVLTSCWSVADTRARLFSLPAHSSVPGTCMMVVAD